MKKILVYLFCFAAGVCNIAYADLSQNTEYIVNELERVSLKKVISGGYSSDMYGYISGENFAELIYNVVTPVGNHANIGASIDNRGIATVTSGKFVYNTADLKGGAVYNEGNITLKSNNFNHNSSKADGGAVYINSILDNNKETLTSNTFNNNSAQNGGAIFVEEGNVTISKNIFGSYANNGNHASENGGAIYNKGSNTKISSSKFSNNSAGSNGGDIYNEGVLEISKSTFGYSSKKLTLNKKVKEVYGEISGDEGVSISDLMDKNLIYYTDTGLPYYIGSYAENGGSVYNAGTLVIKSSAFSQNHAVLGGALYNANKIVGTSVKKGVTSEVAGLTSTKFVSNSAENGGAVFNADDAYLWMSKGTFISNTANEGGAIYNEGEIRIDSSTFGKKNTKKVVNSNSAVNGGAVYNIGIANINKSTFTNNIAAENGGGIFNIGTLNLVSSNFTSNSAVSGGGLFNGGAVNISAGKFTTNKAESGGAIYNAIVETENGETLVGELNISGKASFSKNTAVNAGGAIYNSGNLNSGYQVTYSSNSAKNGGAIFNTGTITLDSGTFSKNSAKGIATTREVTYIGKKESENKVYELADMDGGNGGAIYNADGGILNIKEYEYLSGKKVKVSKPTFSSNTALRGGAIYNEGTLDVANAVFKSNKVTAPSQSSIVEKINDVTQLYYSPVGGAIYNAGTILEDMQYLNTDDKYVYNLIEGGYIGTNVIGENQVLFADSESAEGMVYTYSTDENDVYKYVTDEQYIVFNGKYYDINQVGQSVDYDKSMQLTDTQIVVNGKVFDFTGISPIEGMEYITDTSLNQYSIVVNGFIYSVEGADTEGLYTEGLTSLKEGQFIYNGNIYDTSKIEANEYSSGIYLTKDQILYNGKVYNKSDLKPTQYETGTVLESDELGYRGVVYKYTTKETDEALERITIDKEDYFLLEVVKIDKLYFGETPTYDSENSWVGYEGYYYQASEISKEDADNIGEGIVVVEIDGKYYQLATDRVQENKVYVAPSNLTNGQIVIDGMIYDFSIKDLNAEDYAPTTNLQTGQIVIDGKVHTCFTDESKDKGVVYLPNPDKNKGQIVYDDFVYDLNSDKSATKGEYYIKSDMKIENASFTSNTASSKVVYQITDDKTQVTMYAGMGGAIYNSSEGELELNGTSFSKNSAAQAGGAIYSAAENGELNIDGSTFTSNSAKSVTTTVKTITDEKTNKTTKFKTTANAGKGGAIYTASKTSVKNSVFKSNLAYNTGGAIFSTGKLNLDNVTFQSNKSYVEAGAIFASGEADIKNTTFTSNSTYLYGGAVSTDGDVKISDSIFKSNTSKGFGGAIYNSDKLDINNVQFTSNKATAQGGAMYAYGTVTQQNCTYTSNSALQGGALFLQVQISGVYAIYIDFTDGLAKVVVDDKVYEYTDVLTSEKEGYTKVGNLYYKLNEEPVETLEEPTEDKVIVSNGSSFTSNTAKEIGGAIVNLGTMKLNGTIFDNNTAENGGAIYNAGTGVIQGAGFLNTKKKISVLGGAIYNESNMTVIDSRFEKNLAKGYGGAIFSNSTLFTADNDFAENQSAYAGGAVANYGGTFTSIGDNFTKNFSIFGGAVYLNSKYDQKSLTLSDGKFEENNAYYGGAIYSIVSQELDSNGNVALDKDGKPKPIVNSTLTISDTSFVKNTAVYYGGAVYIVNTNIAAEHLTFDNNKATLYGGAVIIGGQNDVVAIDSSTFNENIANMSGGAIYNAGTLNINIPAADQDDNEETDKTEDTESSDTTDDTDSSETPETPEEPEKVLETTHFTKNFADNGGAIFNEGKAKIDLRNVVFDGNYVTCNGGAINNNGTANIEDAEFVNNYAYHKSKDNKGGAIYNNGYIEGNISHLAAMTIKNTSFSGNYADFGGAIYNVGTVTIMDSYIGISDKYFIGNSANKGGGAVWNSGKVTFDGTRVYGNSAKTNGGAVLNSGTLNLLASVFGDIDKVITDEAGEEQTVARGNSAIGSGGAIYNTGVVDVNSSSFYNNTAGANGGAIYNNYTLLINSISKEDDDSELFNFNQSIFENNIAKTNGGAIYNGKTTYIGINYYDTDTIKTFYDYDETKQTVLFRANSAQNGGAIYNKSVLFIGNTRFENNIANGGSGGAIYNASQSMLMSNVSFMNNSATLNGGAVYHSSTSKCDIRNSYFEGNHSNSNGGAIYAGTESSIQLVDCSFVNNTADGLGGAIYADKGSSVMIFAESKDVLFEGNKAGGQSSAIHLNNASLSLTALNGNTITINDYITGSGTITFSGDIKLVNEDYVPGKSVLVLKDAYLNLANNSTRIFRVSAFSVDPSSTFGIDMDLKTAESDKVQSDNIEPGTPVTVSYVNIVNNSKTPVTIDVGKDSIVSSISTNKAESAEATYKLKSYYDENGLLRVVAYGQKAKPAAVAAPVAAQIGGYLTQINSYDQAFMNMDMNMLKTREERQAEELQNKYALSTAGYSDFNEETDISYNAKGLWNRPYATFERVNLNNGPKVSNIGYGNYFGGDADMKTLNNGWKRQFSAYIGYNGSVQDYNGQSIDQNGGTIGVTEVWYKKNFFTGLTLNAGANVAQASTDLGRENMPMFMTGIASKTGYNFEFKEGKFIVQPSLLLSYSFIHTFSHDNGRGSHVGSSPLNAIQVAPGIKFIANLKNGWQPYLGVNMRWNIIDKTHFSLQDVNIPDMSIDPYVEYGVGLQRRWGERFTGFGQAMIRNGGRNGVMLSFGFKWLIGK